MKYELYNEIVFNQDIAEYSIKKGDIGTLIDYYSSPDSGMEDGYSVEIFDVFGNTINVVSIPESKISKLKQNSVLSARELEFV